MASADDIRRGIPAVVTGAYLAARPVIEKIDPDSDFQAWVLFFVILFLSAVSSFTLGADSRTLSLKQRLFTSISFFIWALNIDFDKIQKISPIDRVTAYLIPLSALFWTLLVVRAFTGRKADGNA